MDSDTGDLVLPTADVSNTSDAFTLPLTSANNAIRSFKLTPGLTYNFRLVANDTGGNVGFGSVTVVVNSPPTSGTFTVSPSSGYAMQDSFTLTCSLWSDDKDDYPLSYSYGVLSAASFKLLQDNAADVNALVAQLRKSMTPLVATQLSPTATTKMFPPGNLADSENVTIVAFISDRLGAVALAYDTIEVLLPEAAKAQPTTFLSSLFDANHNLISSGDASEDVRQVLSASMVLETAFSSSSSSDGPTTKTRRLASCPEGLVGANCATEIAVVQQMNAAILATVSTAVSTMEPSSSGLGLQAHVISSVMRGAPQVLSASEISLVTQLSSGIAGSALTLDAPGEFLDLTSDTLLEVIAVLLGLSSPSSSTTSSARRLSDSDNVTCSDTVESAGTRANWNNMVRTLQSLATLSSEGLLGDEPPTTLEASDVRTYSSRGSSFTDAPSSELSMSLTSTSVACLGSDLYLDAFSLAKSPHSACTLNKSEAISRLTLFSVHSQAALDEAAAVTTYSSDAGVDMQTLASTSTCVRAASDSMRRLTSDDTEAETEKWMPLVALTIPHQRELSAIEQSNFSTACKTWDAEISSWSVDVCFKDDSMSTSEMTVCYCREVESALEVLVTLEERLDFYALHPGCTGTTSRRSSSASRSPSSLGSS